MELYPSASDSRQNDVAILALIQQVHEKVDAMQSALNKHMGDETVVLAEEIKRLMDRAFPNGDAEGHKAAHAAWIKKVESRAEFWKKMTFELSKWGLVGFVGWAALQIWKAFVEGPK